MKTIRSIIFTIIIPGGVAVGIPFWLLAGHRVSDFDAGLLRWLALLPGIAGLLLLFISVFEFLLKGGGSPAIWFTRPLSWLIGKEPDQLVEGRFYRFTRNPMYLGVFLLVMGESLWFSSFRLLGYALLLFAVFHLVVKYLEEPHLRNKYGEPYLEYCRKVPRWI